MKKVGKKFPFLLHGCVINSGIAHCTFDPENKENIMISDNQDSQIC